MTRNETGSKHPQPIAPILFLDTNGIHYLRLSVSLAEKEGRKILDMDLDGFETLVKDAKIWKHSGAYYVRGFRIAHYLATRAKKHDARVQYAPVSGFELLCGGLRGSAIINAARGRVPHRWYSRLGEAELLHYLRPDDFDKNYSDCLSMPELFQGQLGFTVGEADERNLGRVFELAKSILNSTFLELGDCLVYASAMLARAEAIITCDGHLANVIRLVHTPSGEDSEFAEQFKRAEPIIRDGLAAILEVPPSQAQLPQALTISDIKRTHPLGDIR